MHGTRALTTTGNGNATAIKALIAKASKCDSEAASLDKQGEKIAERREHILKKREQFITSAAQLLKKDREAMPHGAWLPHLKKIGIGKSRAAELLQIAGGSNTIAKVRSETAARKIKHRQISVPKTGNGNLPASPPAKIAAKPKSTTKQAEAFGYRLQDETNAIISEINAWREANSITPNDAIIVGTYLQSSADKLLSLAQALDDR